MKNITTDNLKKEFVIYSKLDKELNLTKESLTKLCRIYFFENKDKDLKLISYNTFKKNGYTGIKDVKTRKLVKEIIGNNIDSYNVLYMGFISSKHVKSIQNGKVILNDDVKNLSAKTMQNQNLTKERIKQFGDFEEEEKTIKSDDKNERQSLKGSYKDINNLSTGDVIAIMDRYIKQKLTVDIKDEKLDFTDKKRLNEIFNLGLNILKDTQPIQKQATK